MATLGKIRNHGTLLLIVVGLAMLAFILTGIMENTNGILHHDDSVIAKINGKKIDGKDYETLRAQVENYFKRVVWQVDNLNEQQRDIVTAQTWNILKEREILADAAEEAGIVVTNEEVVQLCLGDHPHPLVRNIFSDPEGNFNPLYFAYYIHQIATVKGTKEESSMRAEADFLLFIEQTVRQEYLKEKYAGLLGSLVGPNKLEEDYAFNAGKTHASVAYAMQSYNSLSSTIEVSDKEIMKLYDEKKTFYRQQPNRELQCVVFDIQPSEQDYAAERDKFYAAFEGFKTTENIKKFLNDQNSEVKYDEKDFSAETVPVMYKNFAFSGKAGDVSEVYEYSNIFSAARIMKAGYSMPDSVEVRLSYIAANQLDSIKKEWSKSTSKEELVWFKQDMFNRRDMYEKVFSAAVGEVVTFPAGVNQNTESLLAVKINKRSPSTPKVKLAILQTTVTPSSQTLADIRNKAAQFASSVTCEQMADSAREVGAYFIPPVAVNADMQKLSYTIYNYAYNLDDSRKIIRWAFNEAKKDKLEVFECGEQIVVAALTATHDGEYKDLEQVEVILRQELTNKKAGEIIAKNLVGVKNIEEAANIMKTDVQLAESINPNVPQVFAAEPAVLGAAMRLQEGELSEPIHGNNGVYVLKGMGKTTEAGERGDVTNYQLAYKYQWLISSIWETLSQDAKIVDDRVKHL